MLFRTCESAFLASFKVFVCNEGRDSVRSAANCSPGLSLAGLGLLEAERENARAGFVHSAGSLHAGRLVVVRFGLSVVVYSVHFAAGLLSVAGLLSDLLFDLGGGQRMRN